MKTKILVILFLCFITTGCWNYNELNDLAIVTGIGIDKHESGYKVSLMISNAQSQQSSTKEGQAQTSVFTGTGKNINEALVNIEVKNPRNLYLGHLAVAVIDDEIAREKMDVVVDALMRNPETAKKYYVIVARENKAEDILKSLSPLEAFPSQNISLNIQNSSKNQGISNNTLLSDFIKTLLNPGIDGTLPSISLQGDPNEIDNQEDLEETEPNAMLKIRTIALFKDLKLVNFTTEKESQGINILSNTSERMHLTNEMGNDEYDVVLLDSLKTKIDLKIENEIIVNITVKAEGALAETNRKINLTDSREIEKINKATEKKLKELAYAGINVSKKYKADVLGFGNLIYKNNPKYWKKIEKDWNDLYLPNLKVNVKTNVNIKTKGALDNTIKEDKK